MTTLSDPNEPVGDEDVPSTKPLRGASISSVGRFQRVDLGRPDALEVDGRAATPSLVDSIPVTGAPSMFLAIPPGPRTTTFYLLRDPVTDEMSWKTPAEIKALRDAWRRLEIERDGVQATLASPPCLFLDADVAPECWRLELQLPSGSLAVVEEILRPYALWLWTPTTYGTPWPMGSNVHRGNDLWCVWNGGKRALAVLHGFLDRGNAAFGSEPRGALSRDTVERLSSIYDGQMFAFDRPTITRSPEQNVDRLLEELRKTPPLRPLTLDLLCHSQGGLVARELATRVAELKALRITLGTIVFVATPNAGTALARIEEGEKIIESKLIEMFTKLFFRGSEDAASEAFAMMFKLFDDEIQGIADLPGIQAMVRGEAFLTRLNESPPSYRAYGIASAFTRAPKGTLVRLLDAAIPLASSVFANEANDLVVPTEGVAGERDAGKFSIPSPNIRRCPEADGIWHLSYFGGAATQTEIVRWLSPVPASPVR